MAVFPWPKDKFLGLLICLVLLLVVSPFFYNYSVAKTIFKIFLSSVLLLSVYTSTRRKHASIIALFLAIPALLSGWWTHFFEFPFLHFIEHGFAIALFGYIIFLILSIIFHAKIVTADIIYGAVCVYFLIGLEWGLIYSVMEIIHPGSFNVNVSDIVENEEAIGPLHHSNFIYYSFITLTTLGYGDITPAIPSARSMSSLEASFGQLYLAILIARLVGLHLVHKNNLKKGE